MAENLNKTDSRVSALAEVKSGRVAYDPSLGEYEVTGTDGGDTETARGALRRTYSELRSAGLVHPADPEAKSTMTLTDRGAVAAREWEID